MKQRKKASLFLILFCAVLLLTAIVPLVKFYTGYRVYKNIEYGQGKLNVIDVYMPNRQKSNGVILFIHGGSWTGGDKSEEDFRCRILASNGFMSATLNYSLYSQETASEYSVFTVLNEIDLALNKLKEFASSSGQNINKVALCGYSAGAHLATLYSYSRTESAPLKIAFTASMAGPVDISTNAWSEELTSSIASILLQKDISKEDVLDGSVNDILLTISPISYISKNSPPTLIIHGGKDEVVSIKNAEALVQKLTENNVEFKYFYLENSTHALIENPFKHIKFLNELINYSKKYFT